MKFFELKTVKKTLVWQIMSCTKCQLIISLTICMVILLATIIAVFRLWKHEPDGLFDDHGQVTSRLWARFGKYA